MKNKEPKMFKCVTLRERAERMSGTFETSESMTPEQLQQSLHELHVHQIELEMQNEQLRHTQLELETSRERYFELYDLAPVGYCTISESNLVLEANLTIAELLGITLSALVNQPFFNFIMRDDQDVFYRLCRQLHENGRRQTGELRFKKKGDIPFWVQILISDYREPDGTLVSRVIVSDITERKLAQVALQKISDGLEIQVSERTADLQTTMHMLELERQRFIDVLDMLPAYVILLTPDHHVPFANRFFTERFGQSNDKRCFEYLFDLTEPCMNCESFKPFTTRAPHNWEWVGPDDHNYDIHDYIFTDADGSRLIMEVGIDITKRKHAEAELLESNEMKLLGQLTSGVAHEVRNPLNGIMAIMGALSKELPDEERFRPYIKHMRNQVNRLSVLMEDLLALGKPLRNEYMQEIQIAAFAEKTIAAWLPTLQTLKKASVRFIHPENPDELVIKADAASITQVIINLLENAFNHSPEGTEITCSICKHHVDNVAFIVKDKGTGISAGIMHKIFEPFFTTRKGGTGLGLSIIRRIIDNHKGTIRAYNNTDGPGATFEIVLPLDISNQHRSPGHR